MGEAKYIAYANRRHSISAPGTPAVAGVRPGPRLRGGNRKCKRGALSGCSRSLQAERISLIGETEFVVPQRCNFLLNRLIQRDLLGGGSGVRVVRSRFSLYLCPLALARSRRWSEQALPRKLATVMVSPPAPVRRVPCRCPARRRLWHDDHRVDHRAAISISADDRSSGRPRGAARPYRGGREIRVERRQGFASPFEGRACGAIAPNAERSIGGNRDDGS